MDELAGLTGEARRRAVDRFHLLNLTWKNDHPLKAVAGAAGIPFRTAQRWVSLYRRQLPAAEPPPYQDGRILEINSLQQVAKAVVEAARESLVIGQA